MTEDQESIFGSESEKQEIIKAAKKLLLDLGYRVTDPVIVNAEIDNQKKLRDYFYMRLDSKYPNRRANHVPNNTLDMQLISKLVQSRIDAGLGKKAAVQECVAVIDVIFNHEDEFKFKYPIQDTRILGQAKLGWVTAKALKILSDKEYERQHEELKALAEEVEHSIDSNPEEVGKGLDAILQSMEANNG